MITVLRLQPMIKELYWNSLELEPHIAAFVASDNQDERNEIFERHLRIPMEKLVECTCHGFKMDYLGESDQDVQAQVLSELVTLLPKFNVQEGAGKSFSYFSTCAKYYLIHWNEKGYRKTKKEISMDTTDEYDNIPMIDKLEAPAKDDKTEFIGQLMEWFGNNVDGLFSNWKDKEIAKELIGLFSSDIELDDNHVLTSTRLQKLIDTKGLHDSNCTYESLTHRISVVRTKMREYVNKLKEEYESKGIINLSQCKGIRRISISSEGVKTVSVEEPVAPEYFLSDIEVDNIRKEYTYGKLTQQGLGRKYNVNHRTIGRILKGEIHKDTLPADYKVPEMISGYLLFGEDHPSTKLTNAQVLEIVEKYKQGMSQAGLGREYKVCSHTINDIVSGRHWGKITGIVRKEAVTSR